MMSEPERTALHLVHAAYFAAHPEDRGGLSVRLLDGEPHLCQSLAMMRRLVQWTLTRGLAADPSGPDMTGEALRLMEVLAQMATAARQPDDA
jgi:hypothetical protein